MKQIVKEFEAQAQHVNGKRCHGEKKNTVGYHIQSSKVLTVSEELSSSLLWMSVYLKNTRMRWIFVDG